MTSTIRAILAMVAAATIAAITALLITGVTGVTGLTAPAGTGGNSADETETKSFQIAQASPPAAQPALPVSLDQALYLIRSTLLTLNDANRSGNYTVLRDLAAPGFQAGNTAADLARIFTDLRGRKFDLYQTATMAPQLTSPPHLTNNNMLRLTGFFPAKPEQINFDLLFQNVGGQWRLFGISVSTPQTGETQKPAAAKPAAPAAKPASPARPAR